MGRAQRVRVCGVEMINVAEKTKGLVSIMKLAWVLAVIMANVKGFPISAEASASFEREDAEAALQTMGEDMPWTVPFKAVRVCLQSDSPYTIRFSMAHGESVHTVDCICPWRTKMWICMEEEEIDDDMECTTSEARSNG